MSQENVERYRRLVDAWPRRDLDFLGDAASPDFEMSSPLAKIEGAYRGLGGMQRWWRDLREVFPDWNAELADVRAVGSATVASYRVSGHGGESGAPVEQTRWNVTWWDDDKAVRSSWYASEAEALEALGLSG